jgi:hypothetical protein
MKYIGTILVSLVFMHALVMHPLLVECVQTDGEFLMEIMGFDPCHGFLGAMSGNTGQDLAPSAVASINIGRDPCLDLFMDGPGGTPVSAHLRPLSKPSPNQAICLYHPAFTAGSFGGVIDLSLKPLLPHRKHSQSVLTLRI